VASEGVAQLQEAVAALAEYEGFPAHALAVRRRSGA
jgi:histidinol dehydrogenase